MVIDRILSAYFRLRDDFLELRSKAVQASRGLRDPWGSRIRSVLQWGSDQGGAERAERNASEISMKDVLLIDDIRVIPATRVARTYDEGISQLKEKVPELLLLDHDLGHEEPNKTGYDIVCFMEENNIKPKEVRLVTANPVGMMKMEAALESMGYAHDHLPRLWYLKR